MDGLSTGRTRLSLSDEMNFDFEGCNSMGSTTTASSTVISIESAISYQLPRLKLDLFSSLDLKTPPMEENDADGILNSINREIRNNFEDNNRQKLYLANTFWDNSPWSLPK